MSSPVDPVTNGAMADWVGTSCTGTQGSSAACTYLTADATVGSNIYALHGYTPSSADVGKLFRVDCNIGVNGGASTTGPGESAGGPCSPEIAKVSSTLAAGSGGCASGSSGCVVATTVSGGSTSANATNTITGGQFNMGTDSTSAFQTTFNGAGDVDLTHESKRFVIFGFLFPSHSGQKIEMAPGTEIFDMSAGSPNKLNGLFDLNLANIGVYGGKIYESNTWNTASEPWNGFDFCCAPLYVTSTGALMKGITFFHVRSDSVVEVTNGTQTASGNTSQYNSFFGPCYVGANNIINSDSNLFKNSYHQDCGDDVEPNTAADGGSITLNDKYQFNQYDFDFGGDTCGGASSSCISWACGNQGSTNCLNITVQNNYVSGNAGIWPVCNGSGTAGPNYTNNTYTLSPGGASCTPGSTGCAFNRYDSCTVR